MSRHPLLARLCTLLAVVVPLPASAAAVELEHPESRELVAFVRAAGELVAPNPAGACAALKDPGSPWRAGDRYVFVIDMAGISRCHPTRPDLEGNAITALHDPDGKPIVDHFLRELAGGRRDGWVHYLWPRPDDGTLRWKSSYLVRVTDPLGIDYIVGAGAWNLKPERAFVVDQVDEAAELLGREGEKAFAALHDPASQFRFLDTYVFVFDTAGVQRVNAAFPNLEGSNLLDWTDTEGTAPGKAMLELLATQESGWVEYLWPRPGNQKPSRKAAYVRKVTADGQTLVVGSGFYPD